MDSLDEYLASKPVEVSALSPIEIDHLKTVIDESEEIGEKLFETMELAIDGHNVMAVFLALGAFPVMAAEGAGADLVHFMRVLRFAEHVHKSPDITDEEALTTKESDRGTP